MLKFGICLLSLCLLLCHLSRADTIIINGDQNSTASIPTEVKNESISQEILDKTDFDKLVGLTDGLIKTGEQLEKVSSYLESREQGQNLRDDIVNKSMTILLEENTALRSTLDKRQEDIEELQDQVQTIQISLARHQLIYWVSTALVILFTIGAMRIYHAYKYNKKSYWLVKYLRNLWPFAINPPDPDEVKYKVR